MPCQIFIHAMALETMMHKNENERIWRIRDKKYGDEKDVLLTAHWEVSLDPISDDYTPQEISAHDLLAKWIQMVQDDYPDGLVPIYWSVHSTEGGFEQMPFQCKKNALLHYDFLTFYTHPEDPVTGERLNWLSLPVIDKFWNSQKASKGGFIQQATGWKPSILQPFVYLQALTNFFD